MLWRLFELLRSPRSARPRAAANRVQSAPARPRGAPRRSNRSRPTLEALEDRCLLDGIRLDAVPGLSGFVNPLLVTNAHDSTNRLFVVEQRGRILVQQPGGGAASVFLDISAAAPNPAHRQVDSGGESGLLGLAFHPQFASNGRFYLHFTRTGLPNTNDIMEFRVSANPNVADPDSGRLLIHIPQPFDNHNGGSIEFSPQDGLLYIGKGDGGSSNDPGNRAQNVNELLGKILRIDVNRDDFPTDPNRNYGIPADNPYVGVNGADEIYALGLRNPYRFSFDRGTGQLYVGDVGQSAREEIDIVTRGGNYGWRAFEGSIPTPGGPNGQPLYPNEVAALQGIAIPPITDLDRTLARSIIGGYVYRGTQNTLPVGSYLFGDFVTGKVFQFNNGVRTTLLDNTGINIASFGEDEAGELYVAGYGNGVIYKVVPVPPPDQQPPTVTSTSPAANATGVSTSVVVSAIFSEALDPASVNTNTFTLRDSVGALVTATIGYNASSFQVTLTPTFTLSAGTTYTATLAGGTSGPRILDLAGNALAQNFSWSFTTMTAPPAGSGLSLWNNATVPTVASRNDPYAVELGTRFSVDVAGSVTALRFYKGAGNTGTHVGSLWSTSGQLLGQVTFANETATGWQQASLITPVALAANTAYIVSYHAPNGGYAFDQDYFGFTGVNNGVLHAPPNSVSGRNGVYAYGSSSLFPAFSYADSNYWVDVVFVPAGP